MIQINNSIKQNDECCNNCGSDIKHVLNVMKHLCKGLAIDEPDTIIYEVYDEPVCTNCDEMSEVITKAEFANRVKALFLKVHCDCEIECDLIEHFQKIAKTMLN